MDTDLQAAPGKLLVIQQAVKTETEGGIEIPEKARSRVPVGIVFRTGPDIEQSPVGPGDTVYWSGFAGEDLHHEGTIYRVLAYEDILAWAPAQKGDTDNGG